MLTKSQNMSALEWFFRNKSSASNFPQDSSSPELKDLCNALDELCRNLPLEDMGSKAKELQKYFVEWVKQTTRDSIDKQHLMDLIAKVQELMELIKLPNQQSVNVNSLDSLKETVISLAILAKQTQDIEFRKRVIDLAKGFPKEPVIASSSST